MSRDDAAADLTTTGAAAERPSGAPPPARAAGDPVELRIPVRADLLVLARLSVATVASRAGFSFDDVEDLRLAVEELCLSVTGAASTGLLCIRVTNDPEGITVVSELVPDAEGSLTLAAERPTGELADDLSLRIVGALVDEHGRDSVDGRPRAWLRKLGGRVEP